MNGASRYLAVVPAYNEAATVGRRGRARCTSTRPTSTCVVVDDGSTDETARIAAAAGADVVRLPFNLGIGGAVQAGFIYACEHGYDYMVQVDGDGQHDAGARSASCIEAMDEDPTLDMVCGSRFLRATGTPRRSAAGPASTSSRSCCRASSASA